jgi:hypothetical protein
MLSTPFTPEWSPARTLDAQALKLDHMQIAPLSAFVLAKKRAAIQLAFRGRIGISVARAPER